MISYKDMTFCRESKCARFGDEDGDCPRSLTKKVRQNAALWWGDFKGNEEAPIAVWSSRPDCFIQKEVDDE